MLREEIEKYKPYNDQEESDKNVILKYMDTFDNLLTRENEFAHFSSSCYIVNRERTKVLMAYHNIYQSWAWIGGHADGEENLLKVALKEANEETGLENLKLISDGIYGIQILPVNGHIKKGKYVSAHLHLDCSFLLEADENDKLKIKEDENSDIKWIDLEDVVKATREPRMIPVYEKCNEKLKLIGEEKYE